MNDVLFRIVMIGAGLGAVFILGIVMWLLSRAAVWGFVEVCDWYTKRRRQKYWDDMIDHPTFEDTVESWGKVEPYNHDDEVGPYTHDDDGVKYAPTELKDFRF